MSGTTGEPLSALPNATYSTSLEIYAIDLSQPVGMRSLRLNASALVSAAVTAAAAAAPPASAGVPAVSAGNTVTTLTSTALVLTVDGGTPQFISPANFVTAVGNRATDPSVGVASAVAAGDRLFVDQGGSSAVAATIATLLAYMQANLAAIYPTITVTPPAGIAAGATYTLAGTLAHYAAAPTLLVSIDAGPANPVPGGSTVTKTTFSLPMPSLPSGSHSVVVTDSRGTLSAPVAVNVALPPEALTLAGPSGTVYAGSDFTLLGTFANTSLAAIDVSLDGGTTYTPASGAVINSGGTFSLPLNISAANAAQVVKVRDRANPSVTATTAAFAVNAAIAATISLDAISGWTAGGAQTFGGSYTGTAPGGVNPAFDSAAYGAPASGFRAAGGRWSAGIAAPAAGAHTLTVQETNNTAIVSSPVNFTVGAAAVGPPLAMTSPLYTDAGQFGAALSGGSGAATLAMDAGGDRTYECWFAAAGPPPDGSHHVIFYETVGQTGLWITAAGLAGSFGEGGSKATSTGIYDGALHHLALTLHPGGTYGSHPPGQALYVDGVVANSDNFPSGANASTTPHFIVAATGSAAISVPIGPLTGYGKVDEASVFNYVKYTGNFTPPTAPYDSSTPGLVAAWHLDHSPASA